MKWSMKQTNVMFIEDIKKQAAFLSVARFFEYTHTLFLDIRQ